MARRSGMRLSPLLAALVGALLPFACAALSGNPGRAALALANGSASNESAAPRDTDGGKCPDPGDDEDKEAKDWVKHGGVVAILFGIFVSFWSLAVVVEEFFVPALNIMCVRLGIPDDVAGATFMAAGASSPEMFSAIISLFITHSALGAGTIIGSEIFNHLCICAGAVLYSKTGELHLEWRILMREVTFYAAACGLLVFSLAEIGDQSGKDCDDWVYLRWYHGVILVAGYITYALVCSFYGKITGALCPFPQSATPDGADPEVVPIGGTSFSPTTGGANPSMAGGAAYNAMETGEAVAVKSRQSTARMRGDDGLGDVALGAEDEAFAVRPMPSGQSVTGRVRGSSLRSTTTEPAANFVSQPNSNLSIVSKVIDAIAPGLAGPEKHKDKEVFAPDRVECYLYKKSRFYNAFRITTRSWQMRWCIVDEDGFRYFRDPEGGGGRAFNIFQGRGDVPVSVEVTDPQRSIFELTIPSCKQPLVVFQAQNPRHMALIVQALQREIARHAPLEGEKPEETARRQQKAWEGAQQRAATQSGDGEAPEQAGEEHEHESLLAWPSSCLGKVFHVILFPFKFLMHYSMIDVRDAGKEKWWWLTCLVSVGWLAAMSYAMTYCVETLGALLGISELVMGLTVSAAGTSFPNVFASMLVARQGLGNMAISNAFGSNVFNILMGLGFPWFLVCMLGTSEANVDGKVYHGMKSGGVAFPVLVLLLLLLLHLVALCFTGMRIYKWHAYVFVCLYIGFLVWAFAWECKGPDLGI
eukprot:TRINITY_DN10708_c0_g5_i1.p1 TRINITY_DN10708_c0_g5~~TRINITY_DN10708_c0_g5_i1.p1  ORF type:complete len:790 (+),score=285.72 TRINITY_DN10708_c0_g5_i1:101-2371(+)